MLKRENRPNWAQIVEKIFFKIFGSKSCMFIYGFSAYYGGDKFGRVDPLDPENRVLARLIKSCPFYNCSSNFVCKYL